MKEIFFNEDGSLSINRTIMSQPSFMRIMEDEVVTDDELREQSNRVVGLFRQVEDSFTDEQKKLVRDLIVESNVLNAIYKQYAAQNPAKI